MSLFRHLALACALVAVHPVARAASAGEDFFERLVRPLLVTHCYECHSAQAKELKGGLRLDFKGGWEKGGHSGPALVPGDPENSLLIKAIRHTEKDLRMPPVSDSRKQLPMEQILVLEQWVKMGAPDPRTEAAALASKPDGSKHWAFQSVSNPAVPKVKNKSWPRSPIDQFLLAKLEEKKLKPASDTDKRTLIRRATFDLIGLPPTPEEVAAFVGDKSPAAFEKVVERLLASPHYGERWGRHWMDLVRYADTAGDNSDYPVPQLYLYRNYIIDSFNRDKPYDQFLREQLAGDLLPAKDQAQRNDQTIATGYIASARRFGSVVDRYPQHLTIEDTLDNMGRAFMGLTLSCARCHDHKFEPLSVQDYYGLYGIFASTRYAFPGIELLKVQKDFVPLIPKAEYEAMMLPFQAKEKELQKIHDDLAEQRRKLEADNVKLDAAIKAATDEAERQKLSDDNAKLHVKIDELRGSVRRAAEKIEAHKKTAPTVAMAYAVQDDKGANAKIQLRGEPDRLGAEVPRKFLDILGGHKLPAEQASASGRRALADWIADAKNPLTARVMVNRIWQHHFGNGLVRTPNDFGLRGEQPTHPELLDWLAHRFVADGWSVKQMHRHIMLSRAYQMASMDDPKQLAADPDNNWLWKFNRRRLDAEAVRDTLLMLSGSLDLSPMTEPHPFPEVEKWTFTQHHPFKDVYPSNRRSIYLMQKRLTAMPYFQTFDGADANATTPARDTSVTTLQALYLMNDEFVHQQAGKFAERLLRDRADDSTRLELAFELVLGRAPTTEERVQSGQYLQTLADRLKDSNGSAKEVWASYARVLLRLNEFLYID
jgi:hypothetical protein